MTTREAELVLLYQATAHARWFRGLGEKAGAPLPKVPPLAPAERAGWLVFLYGSASRALARLPHLSPGLAMLAMPPDVRWLLEQAGEERRA